MYCRISKTFTLLEVIVALTILSTGIMVVFRAFTTTLAVARLSQNMTTANLLFKETLWDLEQRSATSVNIPRSFQDNVFINNRKYTVRYQVADTDQPLLKHFACIIEWEERRNSLYSLEFNTYLMNK